MSQYCIRTADYYYVVSAAVTVESSYVTVSSSTLWSRFSLPSDFVNGQRVDNVVRDLSLATVTGR